MMEKFVVGFQNKKRVTGSERHTAAEDFDKLSF